MVYLEELLEDGFLETPHLKILELLGAYKEEVEELQVQLFKVETQEQEDFKKYLQEMPLEPMK